MMDQTIEIRGLPRDTDEEDVIDLCEEFGLVTEIEVEQKGGRTLFWVTFEEEFEAEYAAEALDRTTIDGAFIRVWLVDEDMDNVVDMDADDEDDGDDDFDYEVDDFSLAGAAE